MAVRSRGSCHTHTHTRTHAHTRTHTWPAPFACSHTRTHGLLATHTHTHMRRLTRCICLPDGLLGSRSCLPLFVFAHTVQQGPRQPMLRAPPHTRDAHKEGERGSTPGCRRRLHTPTRKRTTQHAHTTAPAFVCARAQASCSPPTHAATSAPSAPPASAECAAAHALRCGRPTTSTQQARCHNKRVRCPTRTMGSTRGLVLPLLSAGVARPNNSAPAHTAAPCPAYDRLTKREGSQQDCPAVMSRHPHQQQHAAPSLSHQERVSKQEQMAAHSVRKQDQMAAHSVRTVGTHTCAHTHTRTPRPVLVGPKACAVRMLAASAWGPRTHCAHLHTQCTHAHTGDTCCQQAAQAACSAGFFDCCLNPALPHALHSCHAVGAAWCLAAHCPPPPRRVQLTQHAHASPCGGRRMWALTRRRPCSAACVVHTRHSDNLDAMHLGMHTRRLNA
jgi:hypothetical protein